MICTKFENLEFRIICRLVRSDASILEPLLISCILLKSRVSSAHIPHISKVAEIEKVTKRADETLAALGPVSQRA